MENNNYLIFSSINWDTHRQLHHELIDYLLKNQNKVLYVENTGSRNIKFSDVSRVFGRILTWFKSRIGFDKINDQLSLFSPILFPYPFNSFFIFLNYYILKFLIKRWIKKNNFNNFRIITFLPTPLIQKIIVSLKPEFTIYYCADNYIPQSKFHNKFKYYEKNMFINADLNLFTSEHLKIKNDYSENLLSNLNFHTIHNGVNYNKFFQPKLFETELDNRKETIVGFHGAIRSILDFELLIKITNEVDNILVVLIGPIYEINLNKIINNNKKILYLGEKSHDLIPSYINSFDIGLIPYKKNEFTDCIYPVKLNEFLALGLPVVANELNEIKIFNKNNDNIIDIATNHDEFVRKIKEYQKNKIYNKQKRIEIAKNNSWNNRFKDINKQIQLLKSNGRKQIILFNGSLFSNVKDGARERFLNLIDNFSKISQKYKLIVLESKNYELRNNFINKDSILFIKSPLKSYNPFQRFIIGLFYFDRLFKELNIEYLDTSYVPLISTKKIKTLFTIHDTRYLANERGIVPINRRLIGQFLTLQALHFCQLIICVSETEKRNLIHKKFSNKIKVIPNGVSNFFKRNEYVKEDRNLNEKYILTVGRLEYRKNNILLIEAFEKLVEDFYEGHLIIIGSDAGFRKAIFKKINESKIADKIHLYQDVDDQSLKNYYKNADLFVFPSLFEGFGIPILEAISQSTPYLLSDIDVFKEITQNEAIYFDKYNPMDCMKKMKLILKNKNIQSTILNNSQKILDKYSWSSSSDKYLNILGDI